jgi:hypothetical protein
VFGVFDDVYKWIVVDVKNQRYVILVAIFIFALGLALNLYFDFYSENPAKEYHIYSFVSLLFLFIIAAKASGIYKNRGNTSLWSIGQ